MLKFILMSYILSFLTGLHSTPPSNDVGSFTLDDQLLSITRLDERDLKNAAEMTPSQVYLSFVESSIIEDTWESFSNNPSHSSEFYLLIEYNKQHNQFHVRYKNNRTVSSEDIDQMVAFVNREINKSTSDTVAERIASLEYTDIDPKLIGVRQLIQLTRMEYGVAKYTFRETDMFISQRAKETELLMNLCMIMITSGILMAILSRFSRKL